jgi:hypothetical protein
VIAKKAETNRDLFDWLEFGSIERNNMMKKAEARTFHNKSL